MPPVPLVRAVRSGVEESLHVGSVAVADADARLVAWAGEPDRVAFARSSMKPLQAAVSLGMIDADLSDAEIAVMCASHNGEPVHVEAVERLLGRAGLEAGALRCPPDRPLAGQADGPLPPPERRYHNCSGKHAGMLLACASRGLDLATYREPQHPLQRSVLEAVREVAGEPRAIGVDGCGVPVHALSLREMATLFARLVTPGTVGSVESAARRAVDAMRAEPYLVAGRDRVCTAVMSEVGGVIVKVGAEGLVCGGIAGSGIGVAVKVEDGAARAQAPAIVQALRLLGAVGDTPALAAYERPPLLGGGAPAGHLEAMFELHTP